MKLLWEGSWRSGNITVPELPYYNVFVIVNSSSKNQGAIAIKTANYIRGLNGVSSSGTYVWFNSYNFTFSGTTLSYQQSMSIGAPSNQLSTPIVSEIYGLL